MRRMDKTKLCQPGSPHPSALRLKRRVTRRWVSTFVALEIISEWDPPNLFLKQVHLVQEQNHGCLIEILVVTNVIKHAYALLHPVFLLIFVQHLVVFGDGGDKDNRCDVLKTMNPFAPLIPLSTDVHELEDHPLDRDILRHYTTRPEAGPDHVLLCGDERICTDPLHMFEEILSRVEELELRALLIPKSVSQGAMSDTQERKKEKKKSISTF